MSEKGDDQVREMQDGARRFGELGEPVASAIMLAASVIVRQLDDIGHDIVRVAEEIAETQR